MWTERTRPVSVVFEADFNEAFSHVAVQVCSDGNLERNGVGGRMPYRLNSRAVDVLRGP